MDQRARDGSDREHRRGSAVAMESKAMTRSTEGMVATTSGDKAVDSGGGFAMGMMGLDDCKVRVAVDVDEGEHGPAVTICC